MKKIISYLRCIVLPISADSILFLSKQRWARFTGPLLNLHLRLFYSTSLSHLANDPFSQRKNLDPRIIRSISNLGYIDIGCQLRGTIKTNADIFAQKNKYLPSKSGPDDLLKSLAQGRTVAIVGPAMGADNEKEIEQFDLVVRVGYIGPDGLPGNTGTRCDISFYGPHKMRAVVRSGQLESLLNLKLAVLFKLDRYHRHRLSVDKIKRTLPLFATAALPRFRLTTANTLVKVLYNCILCEPSRIKVFNADLFLSSLYPSGYIVNKKIDSTGKNVAYKNRDMCKSFAKTHDPAEQIEFYKYYFNLGAFEADEKLAAVIGLDVSEYISRLDDIYGKPVRRQLGLI
jgi:hypothetical protein